jgi:hypothetical protein
MKTKITVIFLFLSSHFLYSQVAVKNVYAFGGKYNDLSYDIETDKYGNYYITGQVSYDKNIDFDPDVSILNPPDSINSFIYFAKYDSNNELMWVKFIKSSGAGNNIELDSFGNIYLTGYFGDPFPTDFDPSSNTAYLTRIG